MLISEKAKQVKKEVRSMSNGIGWSLFLYFLIMVGWSTVYYKVCMFFGIGTVSAQKIFEDPFVKSIVQTAVSLFMNLLPALIFCRARLTKPSKLVSFTKPKGENKTAVFFAALGFCIMASLATDFAGSFFESFGLSAPQVSPGMPKGVLGIAVSVISVAIIPALIEEFVTRGIILGALRKFGDGFAIIVSSVLFGFMHATAQQIPFGALVGLALGFIAVKTGSIWLGVGIHAAINSISLLINYTNVYFGSFAAAMLNFAINLLLIAAFIVGVIKLSKGDFFTLSPAKRTDTEIEKETETHTAATEKEKLRWFFTTPTVIIAVAISLAIAFLLR